LQLLDPLIASPSTLQALKDIYSWFPLSKLIWHQKYIWPIG